MKLRLAEKDLDWLLDQIGGFEREQTPTLGQAFKAYANGRIHLRWSRASVPCEYSIVHIPSEKARVIELHWEDESHKISYSLTQRFYSQHVKPLLEEKFKEFVSELEQELDFDTGCSIELKLRSSLEELEKGFKLGKWRVRKWWDWVLGSTSLRRIWTRILGVDRWNERKCYFNARNSSELLRAYNRFLRERRHRYIREVLAL